MAMNWPRWIKREWARCALDAELGGAALGITPSPLREPLYSDIDAVWAFYVSRARDASRSVEIELNPSDSAAYNMARVVWLAGELASDSPVISGWRLSSARRRAFDRYNFTMVPLGRSVGLSVRVSRAVHGDAAWNIVRCKWLEAQVGHLVLSGASSAAAAPRTPAEAAVTGTVGPAVVLDWTNLTYGIEIECIRPSNVSMAEFARQLTEAGVPTNAEHYNHHVRNYWKIVTDGSLSDRNGVGMELVSPILKGTADFEMVRKAAAVLHGDGPRALCRINKTCGLPCPRWSASAGAHAADQRAAALPSLRERDRRLDAAVTAGHGQQLLSADHVHASDGGQHHARNAAVELRLRSVSEGKSGVDLAARHGRVPAACRDDRGREDHLLGHIGSQDDGSRQQRAAAA